MRRLGPRGTALGAHTWTFGVPNGVTGNWVEQSPSQSPPARSGAGVAYDEARGEIVVFGGDDVSNLDLGDTWVWDDGNWTSRNPANKPSPRANPAMAWDPARGEVVLFGGGAGQANPTALADTWVWDGQNWHQKSPSTVPPARSGAAMRFDYRLGKVVMFGGYVNQARLDDTWVWDGSNWTQLSPSEAPSARNGMGLTWDERSAGLVMFGGLEQSGVRQSDTWLFSGSDWSPVNPASSPLGRNGHHFEFNPAAGNALLFGGIVLGGFFANDTWIWDGQGWTEQATRQRPTARFAGSMAFDPSEGAMLLFGGARSGTTYGDTWLYEAQVADPVAEIASPADGSVFEIGEEVLTEFSCSEAPGGPGIETCVDSNGAASPEGSLDTSASGSFTYSVTATSQNGLTGTAEVEYEVAKAAPSIAVAGATDVQLGGTITAQGRLSGGYNASGEIAFSLYGPDDETCSGSPVFESDPVPVDGAGTYEAPGFAPQAAGVYRWVAVYSGDANNEAATSDCDAPGATSTVTTPPPPPLPPVDIDPDEPLVCPDFRAQNRVGRAKPQPPFGKGPKTDGFLVRVRTGFDSAAEIRARVRYRVGGKGRTARLGAFAVRVNGERLLRLAAPAKMRRDFRRAGQRLRGAKATLILAARVKPHGAPARCFQRAPRRTVQLKVTGISRRAAIPARLRRAR